MGYHKCSLPTCTSGRNRGLLFKKFPSDPDLARQWHLSLPAGIKVSDRFYLCELHFDAIQFEKIRVDGKKKLKASAVPSLNLTETSPRKRFGDITNSITNFTQRPRQKCSVNQKLQIAALQDHTYYHSPRSVPNPQLASHVTALKSFESDTIAEATLYDDKENKSPGYLKQSPPDVLESNDMDVTLHATLCDSEENKSPAPEVKNDEDSVTPQSYVCHPSALFVEHQGGVVSIRDVLTELTEKTMELNSLKEELIISPTSGNLQYQGKMLTPDNILSVLSEQNATIEAMKKENEAVQQKLHQLQQSSLKALKKTDSIRRQKSKLKQVVDQRNFSPWLKQEQREILTRRSTRGIKWSEEVIREGLVLKLKCGSSGYDAFVRKIPLYPSLRTLQRSVQFIVFESGMLHAMFNLLEIAFENLDAWERYCQIVLDEMAIQPGERYDPSSKKFVGQATLPSHSGIASKVLVVLLAGVIRRWKISVAVYLTNHKNLAKGEKDSGNMTGKAYKEIVDETVIRAEKSGALVVSICTDMGPDNLAMWKELGIQANRNSDVKCIYPNPNRPTEPIFVIPDPIHLFKGIKSMLESNGTVSLPDSIVKEENLPSNEVHYKHVEDLYDFEVDCELKVAFRLKPENIHCKKHFAKMAVKTHRAVVCHRTSVGLEMLANRTEKSSYRTTAWFFQLLNTFFEVVTARHRGMAVSLHSAETFDKVIKLIKQVQYVFRHMKVGKKGEWKPCQRGMLVLCEALLGLIDTFLNKFGCKYVMLGRFLSDCIENVFACVRKAQSLPHAVAFLQNLKVLTLAQFSEVVRGSSYDYDDAETLPGVDILEEARKLAKERSEAILTKTLEELRANPVPRLTQQDFRKISPWEQCVVYDMAGNAVRRLRSSNMKVCDVCMTALLSKTPGCHSRSALVSAKEYSTLRKEGDKSLKLIYVSDEVFRAILTAEITFRLLRDKTKQFQNTDVQQYFVDNLSYIWAASRIPSCHNVCTKLLNIYIQDRLRQYSSRRQYELNKNSTKVDLSSKSVAKSGCVNNILL